MISARHPCDGFFSEATEAFERIARGLAPDCSDVILDALLANDLIRRTVRVIGRDLQGLILQHGYAISSELRSQWELFLQEPCQQDVRQRPQEVF